MKRPRRYDFPNSKWPCPGCDGRTTEQAATSDRNERACLACGSIVPRPTKKRVLTITEVASMGGKKSRGNMTPEQRSAAAAHASKAKYDRMSAEDRELLRETLRQRAIDRWAKRKK